MRDRLYTIRMSAAELDRLRIVSEYLGMSGASAVRWLIERAENAVLTRRPHAKRRGKR